MKAIIFDLDGTLVDSEKFHRQAYIDVNTTYGLGVDEDRYYEYLINNQGVPDPVFVKRMVESFDLTQDIDDIIKAKHEIYNSMIASQIKPFAGAVDFVKKASEKYKTAIASSSTIEDINAVVDAIGIRNSIDVLVSGNKLERPKPEPDVFLITAEKLGVDIKDCLILEDSKAGLLAAKRSGAVVVAYDNGEGDKDYLKDYNSFVDYSKISLEDMEKYFLKERENESNS